MGKIKNTANYIKLNKKMTVSCVKLFFTSNGFLGNSGVRVFPRGRNAGHALVGCSLDEERSFSMPSPLLMGTMPLVPLHCSGPSGCSSVAWLYPACLYSFSQAVVALFSVLLGSISRHGSCAVIVMAFNS